MRYGVEPRRSIWARTSAASTAFVRAGSTTHPSAAPSTRMPARRSSRRAAMRASTPSTDAEAAGANVTRTGSPSLTATVPSTGTCGARRSST